MSTAPTEKLREMLSLAQWEEAADLWMNLPFEEQQVLFRELPVEYAAKPPVQPMRAIVDSSACRGSSRGCGRGGCTRIHYRGTSR